MRRFLKLEHCRWLENGTKIVFRVLKIFDRQYQTSELVFSVFKTFEVKRRSQVSKELSSCQRKCRILIKSQQRNHLHLWVCGAIYINLTVVLCCIVC